MKKAGNVPKLRFPEFRGAEGWDASILGDLSEVVRGGSPRPIDGFITTSEDGLNWLKIGDVDKEAKYVTNTAEKVRTEALSKTRVVNPGDLILSNSMSFGRPYILQITTCIHDGWIAITKISKQTDRDFLYYLISAPSSQSYFLDNAAGSGVLNLNADIIKALRVSFPKAPEQQKIAECLSSVDVLIAAQGRKLDALRIHKKGLMQQLFPREGETQPRIRFPEFQNAGEWELTKIGNMLVETQRPIGLFDEAEYRLVTVKRRYGGLILRGIMKGREILVKSQFVVRAGDFLISKRQIVHNACGLVTRELDGSVVSNEYSVLTPRPECSIEFFSWFAMQPSVSASFMGCSVGIVIEKMLFKLPAWLKQEFRFPTLPEQQRIADCLTSLDDLITAETQKLEALRIHKKGLMQQLFPSPEESMP
jgi:type I restriction enzyme S subunit